MYKKFLLGLIGNIIVLCASAYDFNSHIGAGSAGVSGASVSKYNLWATYNNQAGIAKFKKATFGAYNDIKFSTNLGTKAIAIAVPTQTGNFGLLLTSLKSLGASFQKFGLIYSKNLSDNFSAGLCMDYFHVSLPQDYGKDGVLTFELGIISQPIPKLSIGAHVFNPINAKYLYQQQDDLPVILKTGVDYLITNEVRLLFEYEKDLDEQPNIKGGVEYNFYKNMFLSFGGASDPSQYSFGFGMDVYFIKANIAISNIENIGGISHISMNYSF